MCAAKNAIGNHGPTERAQSRSWTAVGNGTSTATATRITIAVRMATNRRGGTPDAVSTTAAPSARRVLTTAFTLIKTTGRYPTHALSAVVSRPTGGRCCDGRHRSLLGLEPRTAAPYRREKTKHAVARLKAREKDRRKDFVERPPPTLHGGLR